MNQRFQRSSVRRPIAAALVGTALVCSLAIGGVGFRAAYDAARDEAIKTTELVADQKYEELRLFLQLRTERTQLALNRLNRECTQADAPSRKQCIAHVLTDAISILGAEGAAATGPDDTVQVGKPIPAVPALVGPGTTEIRFLKAPERFLLVTVVSKDRQASLTNRFGMMEILRIFETREHLGGSGETFLADAAGFFITPGRYQSSEGTSHPIHARPMLTCLTGVSGTTLDLDYRDTPIIHGFHYVPDIGGGCIMAHIDQQEAFAPARALGWKLVLYGALVTLATMVLAVALSGALARPIDRLLHQLERAVAAREEFLSIASHELKTPLSAIRLREQLVRRKLQRGLPAAQATSELDELLRLLERQVPRITALIEDMLNIAAIEHGVLAISPAPSDLTQAVQEAASKMTPALREAGIELTVAHAPPILCPFDPPRLEQVLFNLMNNAVKYAPGKPLEIRVSSDSKKATVEVRDHGPGIPPAKQELLFRRFERGGASAKAGGLGLGLYISRHIVEAHGGTLRVESSPGEGATFVIELPLAGGRASG